MIFSFLNVHTRTFFTLLEYQIQATISWQHLFIIFPLNNAI